MLIIILFGCGEGATSNQIEETKNPEQLVLPTKRDVWIFIMAGQSNMAGRGTVEPQDKIENDRILTINSGNQIIVAKEPLHFYEPSNAGLDCGMSFGEEMLKHVPENISLLLIPTAVGGSSIEQWINDENHRGVKLLSNFRLRLQSALKYGELKGILWHQGEANAHAEETIQSYQSNMKILFTKFRDICKIESLPIVIGKLGAYSDNQGSWDRINASIIAYGLSDEFCEVVETSDLNDRGDRIHFNSEGQRSLGKRYAQTISEIIN
tara:strand:- start:17433 stop:18230 length:798 start_codon:yes stop_codon:yes gene_type:complete